MPSLLPQSSLFCACFTAAFTFVFTVYAMLGLAAVGLGPASGMGLAPANASANLGPIMPILATGNQAQLAAIHQHEAYFFTTPLPHKTLINPKLPEPGKICNGHFMGAPIAVCTAYLIGFLSRSFSIFHQKVGVRGHISSFLLIS